MPKPKPKFKTLGHEKVNFMYIVKLLGNFGGFIGLRRPRRVTLYELVVHGVQNHLNSWCAHMCIILRRFLRGKRFSKFFSIIIVMKIFADRLKDLRAEKGVSCVALGKAIGVSEGAIRFWENNKYDIKGEYIVRLAKYFNVSSDYLLGLSDNP